MDFTLQSSFLRLYSFASSAYITEFIETRHDGELSIPSFLLYVVVFKWEFMNCIFSLLLNSL